MTKKKYSEAVIRQIITEYEAGSSIAELRRKYGIPVETYFGSNLSVSPVLIPEKVS